MIADYRFYVSTDGATWGTAVASGRFSNTSLESQVTFASKTGRFVRLRAMTEVNGRPWTTVAELNVLATGSGGSAPTPPPPSGGNTIPQVSLAVFAPSPDHDALVNSYVLQVFPADGGSAVATVDLGKPQVINGECRVDISVLIAGLQPGVYTGTLWAVGDEGSAASEPSPPFAR
jgi:F5/8 type C domain